MRDTREVDDFRCNVCDSVYIYVYTLGRLTILGMPLRKAMSELFGRVVPAC